MYRRVLSKMQELIGAGQYVVSLHAEEEMENDGLTVFDVEEVVLSGDITERQKDRTTGEWKYVVRGRSLDGNMATAIGKIGPTGKLVVITVFSG